MKRSLSSRFIAVAVLAAAALGGATAAQARPDIQVSIGLPGLPLPVLVPPLPTVVVRPQPVYVEPAPVYAPPPVVYERPWEPVYVPELERERAWRHAEWRRREWERREWERREWERREWERRHHHDGFRGPGRD